jgi:hypothetical protein
MTRCKYGHRYEDRLSKCPMCKPTKRVRTAEQYAKHELLNTGPWRTFAKSIIARDHDLCVRCLIKYGKYYMGEVKGNELTCHHILSREHYPGDEYVWNPYNCISLCRRCNGQLGTSDKLDFIYNIPPMNEHTIG